MNHIALCSLVIVFQVDREYPVGYLLDDLPLVVDSVNVLMHEQGLPPISVADYTATDAVSYNTAALGAAMGGGIWLAEDVQPARSALR